MNRTHPGTPSSRRKDWPGDWQERTSTTTRSLALKMRGTFGFDEASAHRLVIEAVRLALSDASMADLESLSVDDELTGATAVTAQAFRLILDGDGIDRTNPMTAETFMAVVQRALDGSLA